MIAEGRFAGAYGIAVVVKSEEFLRRIWEEPRENLCGRQVRVEVFGLGCHAQRIVVTANLDAFAATFAKVAHEDREKPASAGSLLFQGTENGRDIRIGQRQLLDDSNELFS